MFVLHQTFYLIISLNEIDEVYFRKIRYKELTVTALPIKYLPFT